MRPAANGARWQIASATEYCLLRDDGECPGGNAAGSAVPRQHFLLTIAAWPWWRGLNATGHDTAGPGWKSSGVVRNFSVQLMSAARPMEAGPLPVQVGKRRPAVTRSCPVAWVRRDRSAIDQVHPVCDGTRHRSWSPLKTRMMPLSRLTKMAGHGKGIDMRYYFPEPTASLIKPTTSRPAPMRLPAPRDDRDCGTAVPRPGRHAVRQDRTVPAAMRKSRQRRDGLQGWS
jgi:hypothetical protein